jgi:hypothetical protein
MEKKKDVQPKQGKKFDNVRIKSNLKAHRPNSLHEISALNPSKTRPGMNFGMKASGKIEV